MSLIIAAVLIIGGLLAAALLVLAVPALLGVMAFDIAKPAVPGKVRAMEEALEPERSAEKAQESIVLKRSIARVFVIVGGVAWGIAAFTGLYSYRETGTWWILLAAFIPLVATLATLIVGWYYERFTAALLVVATAGVVYWGVVSQFEFGVWMLVIIALIGPMMTASVLFWMARREQHALELFLASQPELATVAVRSR